jgi:hypothetical protein
VNLESIVRINELNAWHTSRTNQKNAKNLDKHGIDFADAVLISMGELSREQIGGETTASTGSQRSRAVRPFYAPALGQVSDFGTSSEQT